MDAPLHIDGSQGEGGGQVLRTALSLSLALGRSIRLTNIRAGRAKPGLLRQHLTCVRAACALTGRECRARLGDTELVFEPGKVRAGTYRFDVGTAGSTALVVQTLLMPLLLAEGLSEVVVTGGTHAPGAPPIEALSQSWLPLLRTLGAVVELELECAGFMPAGGGSVRLRVAGTGADGNARARLQPLALLQRGAARALEVVVHNAHLPSSVAERERRVMLKHWPQASLITREHPKSPGPGNAVVVIASYEHVTEVFQGLGARAVRAERVARNANREFQQYLSASAPVGAHLADQLLVPLALGAGGEYRIAHPSAHLQTNAEVVRAFLPGAVRIARDGLVQVAGRG